jgi:hypothetical protein
MMGDATPLVARELAADRLRAADRARSVPLPTASIVGVEAMHRQRSRVLSSLVLVPRRSGSAAQDSE